MMKDDFAKAYNRLVQKYNKQGYLTENDFIVITEKLDIPLIKLSELQDKLYNTGVEIVELSAVHIKTNTEQTKKRKMPEKSLTNRKTDKYEIIFAEMETFDPQKVKELFFDDYNKARIQSTYIPVLLLAFLENAVQ